MHLSFFSGSISKMPVTECTETEDGVLQALEELGKGFLGEDVTVVRACSTQTNYLFSPGKVFMGDDRLKHYLIPPKFDIRRMDGPKVKLTRKEYVMMRHSFMQLKNIKHVLDYNLHWQWTSSPDEKVDLGELKKSANADYPNWFVIYHYKENI